MSACACGHDDHGSGPGWHDYPQRGPCRTPGCACRVFRPQPPPWREQAACGWRDYWHDVGAQGGWRRWTGWIAGSSASTVVYELLKWAARQAGLYVP